MILTIEVHSEIPDIGRFGILSISSQQFASVEQAWRDNVREISCVPLGVYKLVKYASEKYGNTWALENEDLGVAVYQKGAMRYACLLHHGNWPRNFKGCIGFGEKIAYISGRLGVTNSDSTVNKVLEMLSHEEEHTLIIRRKS